MSGTPDDSTTSDDSGTPDDATDDSSEASQPKPESSEASGFAKLGRSQIGGGVNLDKIFKQMNLAGRTTGIDFSKILGTRRSPLPGVDFSKIAGIQKARLAGIDISKILGTRRSPLPGVDFSKIAGMQQARLAGIDISKILGTRRSPLPGVDFSKIAGMQQARLAGIDLSKIAGTQRSPLLALNLDTALGLKSAHQLLGVDFAQLTGGAALARISTGTDISKIAGIQRSQLPGVDFSKIAGIQKARLAGIDFSAFTSGFDFSKIARGLDLAAGFARLYPSNWPEDVDLDQVAEVIAGDGIPLVWVPRESIVAELLQAPDRSARLAILLGRKAELVEDCRLVLESITEPTLKDQLPLAQAALESYAGGHHQAAQALATVVTETVIGRAVSSKYKKVQDFVLFDPAKVTWRQLRLKAALAPIHRFYTSWYRSNGQPAPEALSRHVTVHEAHTAHFSPSNSVVAVLLVTSVLRAIQELQERSTRLEEKVGAPA